MQKGKIKQWGRSYSSAGPGGGQDREQQGESHYNSNFLDLLYSTMALCKQGP